MLSSGRRPRYRDDIIRALALPKGGRLQFRYRKKYVPAAGFHALSKNKLRGAEALVAYLDASNQQATPEIVPCRFARILESELIGEFAVVRFEVAEFANVAQGVDVREQVSEKLPGGTEVPEWKDGELKGHFLLVLESQAAGWKRAQDPQAWQALADKLGQRQDFQSCPFFYYLRAVAKEPGPSEVQLKEGKYVLTPASMHRVEVVHYTPSTAIPGNEGVLGTLDVCVQGPGVQGVTTQRLRIDSPYDVQQVYFRTVGESQKQYGLLSFGRVVPSQGGNRQSKHADFELVLEVKGLWARQLFVGIVIFLSLAAPKLVDLLGPGPWVTAVVSLLSAVVTAVFVVFGLRKVP